LRSVAADWAMLTRDDGSGKLLEGCVEGQIGRHIVVATTASHCPSCGRGALSLDRPGDDDPDQGQTSRRWPLKRWVYFGKSLAHALLAAGSDKTGKVQTRTPKQRAATGCPRKWWT